MQTSSHADVPVFPLFAVPYSASGQFGYPKTICVDQGSEFVSRDLDLWAYAHDVTLNFSRPGKPTG